jgi:hypothetical protein
MHSETGGESPSLLSLIWDLFSNDDKRTAQDMEVALDPVHLDAISHVASHKSMYHSHLAERMAHE